MRPRRPRTLVVATLALAVAGPLSALSALPAPPAAAALAVGITGPDQATMGDVVQMLADGGVEGSTYAWDLDGDGTFETPTGSDPTAVFGFGKGGAQEVGLRVTAPDGSIGTSTVGVDVKRPLVAGLVLDPPNPKPGQKVTATVVARTDEPGGIAAYTWGVEGVAAQDDDVRVVKPTGDLLGQDLDLTGAALDVTRKPSLTFTMPRGRANLGRSIDLEVTVVDAAGRAVEIDRSVILETLQGGLTTDPYVGKTVNCNNPKASQVPAWPCASMSFPSMVVAHVPAPFQDSTPTVEVCYQEITANAGGGKQLKVTELKQKGYPPPELIAVDAQQVVGQGARTRAGQDPQDGHQDGGAEDRRIDSQQKCKDEGALTQSWDWGDGTSSTGGVGKSGGYFVYNHVWDEPGTYPVTLTTKVPYLLAGDKKDAFKLKYFTATRTEQVTVGESVCGPVSLNGIPAVALTKGASSSGPLGCFGVRTSLDGSHDVYLPAGRLVVGGIELTWTGSAPVVDPATATVSVATGTLSGTLTAKEGTAVGRTRPVVPPTTALQLPPPAYDDQVGAPVVALPAVALDPSLLTNKITGLGITSVQALLSPTGPPLERLWTELPAPFAETSAPLLVADTIPAHRSAAGKIPGVDSDFEIDLSGVDMGAFAITSGQLVHRTAGGWAGELDVDVAQLGTFEAPYKAPNGQVAKTCAEAPSTGPSGLSLKPDGSLDFVGAAVNFNPSLAIGPVGLKCLGLKVQTGSGGEQSGPVVLQGLATAEIPAAAPVVSLDACLSLVILDAGQTAAGCKDTLANSPQDLVWFQATGTVSLAALPVTLGSGYVDVRNGAGYTAIGIGGSVPIDYYVFSGTAGVDGQVIFGDGGTRFSLIGNIHLCADFFLEICGDAQAGVSSKGFGACISVGGAVYRVDGGWKVFFASCDLKKYLAVQRGVQERRAGTSATVAMPADLEKAAFVVHRVNGTSPVTLQLTSPTGQVITDNGRSYQDLGGGSMITKFTGEGVTTVTLTGPEAGQWTIAAQPEVGTCNPRTGCTTTTPDIDVELQTPIPDPVVTGDVVGSGDQRTLDLETDLDPGDRLVLSESGPTGSRLLGNVAAGATSFAIPTAGRAEERTVTAIVERNGIPYTTITLDTYQAPAAPKLAVPAGLVVKPGAGGSSTVSWQPVLGASAYEVTGTLGDGRVVRTRVTGTDAVLSGVTAFTPGSVKVRALGEVGLESSFTSKDLVVPKVVTLSW